MIVCNGICQRYRSNGGATGVGKYGNGFKRCNNPCGVFILYDGMWCPCCGRRLRSKPRNRVIKENYKIRIGMIK